MSTIVQDIPQLIAVHLQDVAAKFGLEVNAENMALLKQGWLDKQRAFRDLVTERGMESSERMDALDPRGALLLTYSGSLISLSPIKEGCRMVEYTSIGLRQDVPESLSMEESNMAEAAVAGEPLSFRDAPLKQTSPIYQIALCPEALTVKEQEELIDETSTVIIDTFIDVNQDMFS